MAWGGIVSRLPGDDDVAGPGTPQSIKVMEHCIQFLLWDLNEVH